MAGNDGFGVKLERETTPGSGNYEAIANITSLSGPGLEREQIDVTAHDSEEQWEEIVFGIKRSGEVEIDVNYDPAKHDMLLDDWNSSNPRGYRITWPDALSTPWAFKAGLANMEPEAPHDDKLAASLTFKVSGKPNFGSAA
ncbi:phage tail tube protein [Streptomonospora algeriensis]|uniref:Phage tail tube protein n=1 Tax=Streptomonospora algeriensis TaxID=995084 RepID=A0ABW3BCD6_9ACTN